VRRAVPTALQRASEVEGLDEALGQHPSNSFVGLGRSMRRKDTLAEAGDVPEEVCLCMCVCVYVDLCVPPIQQLTHTRCPFLTDVCSLFVCLVAQLLDELLRSDDEEDFITSKMFAETTDDQIRRCVVPCGRMCG
jgi:hypothetical protein